MKEKIQKIKELVEENLRSASDLEALENIRIKFLGKKGELTAVLKGMGGLPAEERPVIGAMANEVRAFLEREIDGKKEELSAKLREAKLKKEVIDVTMPGRTQRDGSVVFSIFSRCLCSHRLTGLFVELIIPLISFCLSKLLCLFLQNQLSLLQACLSAFVEESPFRLYL